jgi:hypothetical protein
MKQFFLDIIDEWQMFWMNQTQNNEADRLNYYRRAFGVDANMRGSLARMLTEAIEKRPKHVAILGGGDWADASVDFIKIDPNANMEAYNREYIAWYGQYLHEYRNTNKKPKYYTFAEWLVEFKGATKDDEIEVFE